MNLYTPNGAAVNASSSSLYLQATAAVLAVTSVTALGGHARAAAADVACTATVSAPISLVTRNGAADFLGISKFNLVQTHTLAAAASLDATAHVSAIQELEVDGGTLSLVCDANLVVIPANELGEAAIAADATFSSDPDATKTVFETSSIAADATVAVADGDIDITAGAAATILATASTYVTVGIDDVYEAFAAPTGTASIPAIDVIYYVPSIGLFATADSTAAAFRVRPAPVAVGASGTTVIVDGLITIHPSVACTADATVTAAGIKAQNPTVSALGTAGSQIFGTLNAHIPYVLLDADAAVTALPIHTEAGNAVHNCSSVVTADGVVTKLPTPAITGTASVEDLVPTLLNPGAAAVTCDATVAPNGVRIAMPDAAPDATATVAPNGTRVVLDEPTILADAVVTANGVRFRPSFANVLGQCIIEADSVTNPDALDPPERTFVRPAVDSNFVRPEQEFTFRRLP